MARCLLCEPPEDVPPERLLDHVRLFHPDDYGDGPETWPDGEFVIIDRTLEPSDFSGREDGLSGTGTGT